MSYRAEVVESVEQLVLLEEEWRELEERCQARFYQRFHYYFAYFLHLIDSESNPYVIFIRNTDDKLVCVVPWQRKPMDNSGMAGVALTSVLHNHIYLTDILCDGNFESEVCEYLITWLKKETPVSFIYLQGSLKDSQQHRIATKISPQFSIHREVGGSYSIGLSSDNFESSLPKKMVKNVKRLVRKAENESAIECEFLNGELLSNQVFDEFLSLEASGWKGEVGSNSAIKSDPKLIAFYNHFVQSIPQQVQISRYKLGETLAASHFCFRDNDCLSLAKVSYDESLKEYSPGHVLIYKAMEALASQSIGKISFVTNPVWLDQWKPDSTQVMSLTIALSPVKKLRISVFKLIRELRNKMLKKGR